MNIFTFRKVFVSPHRRTIETAVHMLSSHPQKSQITFILLPLAKESLHTSSDLPVPFAELQAFTASIHSLHGFSFDFSLFAPFSAQLDSWHFQIVANEGKKSHLMKEVSKGVKTPTQVGIDYILKASPNHLIEDDIDTYARTQNLKKFLLNELICLKKPLAPMEKLLVVTHSVIMRALFATGITDDGQFIQPKRFNNCELAPYELD